MHFINEKPVGIISSIMSSMWHKLPVSCYTASKKNRLIEAAKKNLNLKYKKERPSWIAGITVCLMTEICLQFHLWYEIMCQTPMHWCFFLFVSTLHIYLLNIHPLTWYPITYQYHCTGTCCAISHYILLWNSFFFFRTSITYLSFEYSSLN